MKYYLSSFFFLILGFSSTFANPDSLLVEAAILARDSKYEEARNMLSPLADKYPDYLDIKLALAQYNLWDNQPEAALSYAHQVLKKDKKNPDALLIALKSCFAKNDAICFDEQSKAYLKEYPDSSHIVRRNLALLLGQNKKHREARNLLVSLRDSLPFDTEIDVEIATYSFFIGDSDSSLLYANKAIDREVKRHDAHLIALRSCIASKNDSLFDMQAEKYLSVFPDSTATIMVMKGGMLFENEKYSQVIALHDSLMRKSPPDSSLAELAHLARLNSTYHLLGASYSYWFIGNEPDQPRQQITLDYLYKIDKGAFLARVSAANRFDINSYQIEMEAYPIFTKKFYGYAQMSFSDGVLYPYWRLGIEPYYLTDELWELSAGLRYVDFGSLDLFSYTGTIGKYYGNYWSSFRLSYTPFASVGNILNASLSTRGFGAKPLEYWELRVGYGVSPENEYLDRAFALSGLLRSRAFNAAATYQFWPEKEFLVRAGVFYERQTPILQAFGDNNPIQPFDVYGFTLLIQFLLK